MGLVDKEIFYMQKKNTVLISGIFNVVHPGHLRLFRFAKECGEHLIIVVEGDKSAGTSAHVPEQLRLEGVQTNSLVDTAFITNESIKDVIDKLRPDIVVKGKEHEGRQNLEIEVLQKYGGRLLFTSGETIFSSLDLIRKEFDNRDFRLINLPTSFFTRHDVQKQKLVNLVKKFSTLKVCVIGDLIVDEYITCDPLGMSQEDPTIVVTPIDSAHFIGGAGIVAAHASGLGAYTHFISVSGVDQSREYASDQLKKAGVSLTLHNDDSRPTTLKQRYRCKGKTLLRVSHLHQREISMSLQSQILTSFENIAPEIDVLIFSDFNYGCLPQQLIENIISVARSNGIFMAADSQSSSQMGDIGRFKGMDLITPTEREARISVRNSEDGLVVLAERLRQQSSARNILLKLGEEGLLVHADNNNHSGWLTDRIEALNTSPKDLAGAGDSLLITSSMSLACGGNIWEAASLGSLAAALQVGRIGNIPLKFKELLRELS